MGKAKKYNGGKQHLGSVSIKGILDVADDASVHVLSKNGHMSVFDAVGKKKNTLSFSKKNKPVGFKTRNLFCWVSPYAPCGCIYVPNFIGSSELYDPRTGLMCAH